MHLAYDLLDPWDALILVDALPGTGDAGTVVVLEIGADDVGAGGPVDAHGMDPATVLANLAALGGRLPQRTLLVGCRVAETGEGMGLTPPVAAAVDEAVRAVQRLVTDGLRAREVA
jgi:hydrogenase maturation protease